MNTQALTGMAAALVTGALSAAPLPATNDPGAAFENGMFLLPELPSAKDSYLITVQPVQGDPVSVKLPPGATGVRVSTRLLPSGSWSWSYKTALEKPLMLDIRKNAAITAADLKEGKYFLSWPAVPEAEKYVISGESRTRNSPGDEPRWSPFETSCRAEFCAPGELGSKALDLAAGGELKWRVTALDKDGIPLARSGEGEVVVATTWVQRAAAAGFKLQRSETLTKALAGQPALFSYIATQQGASPRESAYQGEFALIYDGPKQWGEFWPRASVEGRLTSSGPNKASDAFVFRAGGYALIAERRAGEGTEIVTSLKFETERKTGTKKGLAEVAFTPVYGPLGVYWPGPPKPDEADPAGNYTRLPWLQVAPLLTFAAEAGKTFDVGSSEEKEDTVVRLRANVRFEAEVNALAVALGTRGVSAYAEGTYWYLPRENADKNHHIAKTGLSFALTDYLSIDLAYSVGHEAPSFKFKRATSVGLGLKF